MKVFLSAKARKNFLILKKSKQGEAIRNALRAIQSNPVEGLNIKRLKKVAQGYRKRIGRYRILYTYNPNEEVIKVWIIDIEKDTKKDYDRWLQYILQNL